MMPKREVGALKVAVVHDWLVARGGGEACVAEFLRYFPSADLFTLVDFLPDSERDFLRGRRITTSFLQKLPWARTKYRAYLPLMPLAIEQLNVTGYDLIISTSSAVSKGIITGPDQIHISYTFSPIRYAWDLQHLYLAESGLTRGVKSIIARLTLHYIRLWDTRTANGVDHFVGISHYIARRIRKAYGRDSTVIYPPVEIERFTLGGDREDFYLTASRFVPYKRIPMIAEAFAAMPDRKLVIIGDGPDMEYVRKFERPNVTILGRQPHDVLVDHMQRAKAFVFAAEEDFGIAPLEAQACGAPVIAYGRGAALETIRGEEGPGQSGVFFQEQTVESLIAAVQAFDERISDIAPEACRANAARFSTAVFRKNIVAFIEHVIAQSDNEASIS